MVHDLVHAHNVRSSDDREVIEYVDESYRVVTKNVPKSMKSRQLILRGEVLRSRSEYNLSAKTMVEVKAGVACDCIKICLFPVYEEKHKEGSQVYKSRMVADCGHITMHGETQIHSATLIREELDILVQVLGALYGLKTAPRDCQEEVGRQLESIGITHLSICKCMYVTRLGEVTVIVYD